MAVFVECPAPVGLPLFVSPSLMDYAQNTLISEFSDEKPEAFQTQAELDNSMDGSDGVVSVVLYAIADTSDGGLRLLGGEIITPDELADALEQLPPEVSPVLIVEGPRSGVFVEGAGRLPQGTTVVTSSSAEKDEENEL